MSLQPRVVSPEGPVLLPTAPPRRVCIVLLSGIGDVVHGLPLALDLKALDPDIEVTWVAEPAPAQLLEHHPAVDRVVTFDSRGGLPGVRALRDAMVNTHAQLTLNVQRYFKSVWPSLFSGAPIRVGLPPSKTRDGVRYSNTHVLKEGPWKHSQDLFLDFRWALGVDRAAPVGWGITFSAEERAEQARFFARLDGRPVVSLVVGSANPKKDWAAERYARLADALDADFGMQVLLVGAESGRDDPDPSRRPTHGLSRGLSAPPHGTPGRLPTGGGPGHGPPPHRPRAGCSGHRALRAHQPLAGRPLATL